MLCNGKRIGILKRKMVNVIQNFCLRVSFDDDKECLYDVNEDMETLQGYDDLKYIHGLHEQVQLYESRTCVFWNDYIDLSSDTIYEYSKEV